MKKSIVIVFLLLVLGCLGVYAVDPVAANFGTTPFTLMEHTASKLDGSASTGADIYNWTLVSYQNYPVTISKSLNNPVATFTSGQYPDTYVFQLDAINSTTNKISSSQVTVKLNRTNQLSIQTLDVKVGGKSAKNLENKANGFLIKEDAKPEDTVKFDVKVKSLFDSNVDDIKIQSIDVKITIESIDDGSYIEQDSSEFDLNAGRSKTVSLDFQVPLKVDEGDYNVHIDIEGDDEQGFTHILLQDLTLRVKKDIHYIKIDQVTLTPDTLTCNRKATLTAEIMNLGRDEETKASLAITNNDLGLNSVTNNLDMSYDWNDDSNTFQKVLTINVPDGFAAGTYPITVKSYYDSKESETKSVDLIVGECKPVVTEPVKETPVTPPENTVVQYNQTVVPEQVVPAQPIVEQQNAPAFMQSSEFYTLVVIVIVLVVGLIIFLIGAFVIKASKK